MSHYLFTSESVSEGHPDKIADQISDAVLDAIIAQDKHARVACETLIKTGMVVLAGEVTTSAWVDLEDLVRKTVVDIGYNSSDIGFDGSTCGVFNAIGVAEPTSVMVNTFGTGTIADEEIVKRVRAVFDLTPYGIIEMLDLIRPIYRQPAAYGHFGRELPDFTWEKTDRADALKR